jgi:kynurenine formamidase
MHRWKQRPPQSNWGDFGDDDEIGRMNLLTPERRLAGLREAREGLVFVLSLPLDYPGGSALAHTRKPPKLIAQERPGTGRPNYNYPFSLENPLFTDVATDDAVLLYTQYSTQWDALGHAGSEFDADGDGAAEIVYYNGFRGHEHVRGPDGHGGEPRAERLGIETLAVTGVQGRGVLVDLASIHGRDNARVGYDGLMRAFDATKSTIEAGDFLCIYTGFADMLLEMRKAPDPAALRASCAVLDGTDDRLLRWISESGIVAICADNFAVEAVDRNPRTQRRHAMLPLHEHCLFKLGLFLGELWYFGELAAWLRAHHRNRFLLTAPPLRLPGAVGSPVTPVATV